MASKPLYILKKGLIKLKESLKIKKEQLETKLARKESMPPHESQVLTETSDNEIYRSVIDAIKARENLEINDGDDVDDEFEIIEPRPTRRDVLKALSTINFKYIDELDDPVSRKIEELLGQLIDNS